MKKFLSVLLMVLLTVMLFASSQGETKTYKVGDRGPAGGYVFYDKGTYSDGWRYLEAAPNNVTDGSKKAYEFGYGTIDETSDAIGMGKSNTKAIVERFGEGEYAAKVCDDYTCNGFDDWFLPSPGELKLMYKNLFMNNKGNFKIGRYWSSYVNYSGDAYYLFMHNGCLYSDNPRDASCSVRPIRAF